MVMYMREPTNDFDPALTLPVRVALGVAAAGTIGIGVFPAWFLGLAQASVFAGH
jgi:NADH-quinone oxidoreductase subunit N